MFKGVNIRNHTYKYNVYEQYNADWIVNFRSFHIDLYCLHNCIRRLNN